jgi:hypothetical protein
MNLPNPFAPLLALAGKAASVFKPVAAGARKPWLVRLVVALLALVLLIALIAALVAIVPTLPARFWQLLGLCLVALALLWWFTAGQRRFSLQGRTRKRMGDLGPGNPDDEREPLARMAQAIAEAKRTITRSPQVEQGRDPLYRVPWMLFLGDGAADVDGLLRAASDVSPFPAPASEPGAVWRWWFFKSLVAVELSPRVVCASGARLERGLWYQALMQLAAERNKLPVNGIVLAVSIQTLLGPADAVKDTATRLRRLVDEAMEHLQVRMPVYIVVTGLERMRGYATMRATLPAEAFTQALGHRLTAAEMAAPAGGALQPVLGPLLDRLHALRMTALRSQVTAVDRRGMFEFGEALRNASSGLSLLVTLLLEDNTFQRTPAWRGLYFVGGADAAHPGGAFVADLFTRFLPGDQPLATPGMRGSAARMAVAGFGVAALLAFSAYLAYGLQMARRDDTRLLASTRSACSEVDGRLGNARIEWVASCGRTIEQLESAADRTLLGFGIRRADRDIGALRERVTNDFANLILAPYDQMLAEDIDHGRANIEHALAIAQRLRMLDHCRGASRWCLEHEADDNVAFDARARLFAPFVTPDNNTVRDRDNAHALFGAYLGYLRWQKKKTLDDEHDRLQAQLQRLMASPAVDMAQLRGWSQARTPGIALTDFWLPRDRQVGVEAGSLPTVPSAYTAPVWAGVVRPFLDTVADNDVHTARVAALHDAYFGDYFRSWAQLQARFGEGVGLWKGHEEELLKRAAGNDNPYALYFAASATQLDALPLKRPLKLRWSTCWAAMKTSWLSSWRPLWRFTRDSIRFDDTVIPPLWLTALRATQVKVLQPQAPVFARAWLRLLSGNAAQDAYRVAADLFAGHGSSDKPPADEYSALLAAVDKPPEGYAEGFSADDAAAWSIAQGPVKLLLRLTVARAAQALQQRWNDGVLKPLSALPPEQQQQALMAPQGKLDGFVGDALAPFLSEHERTPIAVAGVSLPLSPDFRALISGGRAAPTESGPFAAGTFTLDGPSDLVALAEGPQGTTFEVLCNGQTSMITSKGESLSDAQMQLQWSPTSCSEARIRISLPPSAAAAAAQIAAGEPAPADTAASTDPSAPAALPTPSSAPVSDNSFRLTLLYRGAEGFTRLFQDFAPGAHVFSVSDFRDSYSSAQWDQLQPRLQAAGFRQARVRLRIEPSEQLQRFMSASGAAPAQVPQTIVN